MQVSEMNKVQLRAACKEAKIANYGTMSVEKMRAALKKVMTTAEPTRVEASSAPVVKEKPARVRAEERNGVKRPIRGVCADVWAACDALLASGTAPDAKSMRERADKNGWNQTNVSIELGRWRKFNGIARQPKSEVGSAR